MSDTRDEMPTPRLTGTWQIFATAARELSAKLRERELALSQIGASLDTRTAARLRHYRMICESYATSFARWTMDSVAIEDKQRERDEFLELSKLLRLVLQLDAT